MIRNKLRLILCICLDGRIFQCPEMVEVVGGKTPGMIFPYAAWEDW